MIDVEFAPATLPKDGALALLALEGAEPSGLWHEADEACGGALRRAAEAAEFIGKKGQTCTVLAPGAGLQLVVLVGLGKEAEHTLHGMEEAGGAAAAALAKHAMAAIAVDGMPADHAAHAALGAVLRSYRFDLYRTKEGENGKPKLARLTVLTGDPDAARAAWPALDGIAQGSRLARDLISEPPNVLYPAEMAERCRALEELGLEVDVLGPAELTEQGFGALLAVAQGSAHEARVVVMRWNGGGGAQPLCFVGKGVTFDTGGICLKPGANMGDMKWDMAGAGAVVGVMAALARRKARANVVGLVGLTENMPSGTATAARRRGEEPLRADDRGAQHRRRRPAHAGRRDLVRAGAVQPGTDGRPRDAHRRDASSPRPRVRRPFLQRRHACGAAASRPGRRPARRSGGCRWTTTTTS